MRFILCLLITVIVSLPALAQPTPHRDDFQMNSISGGDFRNYITDVITEDDLWANSMRTLGNFHNLMHEMMSELVYYDAKEMDGRDLVPDFENRISGGEWTDYRENMEARDISSPWMDFVHITEIMHDRFHHVMYKSTLYDLHAKGRDADLDDYIGEGRAPYTTEETMPNRDELVLHSVSADEFREFVWHGDYDGPRLHTSLQKMTVF